MPFQFTCLRCSQPFSRPKAQPAFYCSSACYRDGGRVNRSCEHCQQTFSVKLSAVSNGRRYCSRPCQMIGRLRSPLTRFWSKVQKGATCWGWTGAVANGYGQFNQYGPNSSPVRAHRFSWEFHYGKIPDGLWVLHHCDNPPCVRPEHLFLGTAADNSQDMVTKGRGPLGDRNGSRKYPQRLRAARLKWLEEHPGELPHGEQNANAKLRDDEVRCIRDLLATGHTQATIRIVAGDRRL